MTHPSYGVWKVTTEGDEEGRSTDHLGIYEGNLDQIALGLAHRCCYVLEFEPVVPIHQDTLAITRREVFVRLPKDQDVRKLLEGRSVDVSVGNFFKSFKIKVRPNTDYEQIIQKSLATAALSKLTKDEAAALKATWS